jgi:hypothetical protein
MNLYDATVPVFTKFFANIDRWLVKAIAHGQAKKFDPELLVQARLAPDQYPLQKQIQAACDTAKFCVAKLSGKEPPSHPDTETTLAELRARIATVQAYLASFSRDDFAGAEERPCGHLWMQGKMMRGGDYLDHFALPNMYFHIVIVYEILRHNGVELGKTDFMGSLPFNDGTSIGA